MSNESAKGNNQTTQSSNSENSDNTCDVCFRQVKIFAIGECDHPICYECSTRMRVLCQQNECAICRQNQSKVIFTYDKKSYRELETKNRSEYYNKKFKISFYTLDIQKAFYKLLDHPCLICTGQSFSTFEALKDHVRKQHELFFCDLCAEHLRIFTFERRCYNRHELGMHRRKGDPDNTSHRGHPLCEYCDCRYLDRDELFRHLRKDHFFCHFCDADGSNKFYGDYESLKEHFHEAHYVCEEGACAQEQFTGVFRSEIDLKAHIANVHGKTLGKQQVKQARTLQLEITLGPRGRAVDQGIANLRSRNGEDEEEAVSQSTSYQTKSQAPTKINANSEQEFPSLGGGGNSKNINLLGPPMTARLRAGSAGIARTNENFPALGGGGSFDPGVGSSSGARSNFPPVSALLKDKSKTMQMSANQSNGKMVIHVSNRPPANNFASGKKTPGKNDFPALPGSNSKRQGNSRLEEDMVPESTNPHLNSVSSKHRLLVNDYVSVANPTTFQKIQLVQENPKDAKKSKAAATNDNAPKLSKQNFPSLSASNPVVAPAWVKPVKQKTELPKPKPLVQPKQKAGKSFQNVDKITNVEKNTNKNDKKASTNEDSQNQKQPKNNKKSNNNENAASNNGVKTVRKTEANNNFPAAIPGPPPGFAPHNGVVKPPPGFQNVTLNSVAKSPNNLTFTSSMGADFSILPAFSYLQPPNCSKRNQDLVMHFKTTLPSADAMDEFRYISQKFREGVYKPDAYYDHCQSALKDKFDEIFPELLALLPDIAKQQGLYLVHAQRQASNQNTKSNKNQKQPKLKVCSVCKQVLLMSDFNHHSSQHSVDLNFPTLNKSENALKSKNKN